MSLTDTNLRYLFTIYEIAKTKMDVSSKEVARALAVTKPSVVRVLDALMRRSLVVKERYGKIYLTDRGAFTVQYYNALIETVLQNFPDFGFAITEEQRRAAAFAMAAALPDDEYRRRYLALFDEEPCAENEAGTC